MKASPFGHLLLTGLWGRCEGGLRTEVSGKEGHARSLTPPAPSACLLGMFHRHLEHKVRRDFEELRVAAIGLQDQRHHIEAAVLGFPAQVNAQLGTRQAQ